MRISLGFDNNYIRLFRASGPDIQLRGTGGDTGAICFPSRPLKAKTHGSCCRRAQWIDNSAVFRTYRSAQTSFTIPVCQAHRFLLA